MKNQKGVTLIALVVTIVVLLILAGVAIAMLRGDSGILTEATKASDSTAISEAEEAVSNVINEATAKWYDEKYVANKADLDDLGVYVAKAIVNSVASGNLNGKVTTNVSAITDSTTDMTITVVKSYKSGNQSQAKYSIENNKLGSWTHDSTTAPTV